jgi:uncharacterized protein YecE (DUF72 family)
MTKKPKPGALRIGTGGFLHDHWRGVFYPEGLEQDRWIEFYARHFDTLEVESSFYRLLPAATLDRWREQTPPGFMFSLRGSKVITCAKRLTGCAKDLADFRRMAMRLGIKLGAVVWLLPPGMAVDLPLLERFLRVVSQTFRTRHAFEFRNSAWHRAETFDLLARHGAALAVSDARRAVIEGPATGRFVYVRRHGASGSYRRPYNSAALQADAERIRLWRREGRDVFVYFNNDTDGHAVTNARQLREACAE